MKTAIYVLMSLGMSLIFSTMKLMNSAGADRFEFVHRAILGGLGLFGIGLLMAGGIGILYMVFFSEKSE